MGANASLFGKCQQDACETSLTVRHCPPPYDSYMHYCADPVSRDPRLCLSTVIREVKASLNSVHHKQLFQVPTVQQDLAKAKSFEEASTVIEQAIDETTQLKQDAVGCDKTQQESSGWNAKTVRITCPYRKVEEFYANKQVPAGKGECGCGGGWQPREWFHSSVEHDHHEYIAELENCLATIQQAQQEWDE